MLTLLVIVLCATAASARNVYIVGGSEAAVGAYKYQVSLRSNGNHWCGGTLIGDQWIMTAAHCTYASVTSVTIGMHDQSQTKGNPKTHEVSNYYRHPDYVGGGNYPNDIALMKLSTKVDLSNTYVELANMAPDDGFTYAGSDCHISGWGHLSGGGQFPENLQEAKIDCLSNTECQEYYDDVMTEIETGHICIFDKSRNKVSACNGDSGSPMTCKRNNVRYVVGVASWVYAGCDPRYPGAYTRVSEYRDFIKEISGL